HQANVAVLAERLGCRGRKFRSHSLGVEKPLSDRLVEFQYAAKRPGDAIFFGTFGNPTDAGCTSQRGRSANGETTARKSVDLVFGRQRRRGAADIRQWLIHGSAPPTKRLRIP